MADETKQPWTPGPWEVFGGRLIRSVHGGTTTPIAETRNPYRHGVGPVRAHEEDAANGVLMAGAPVMAEALARFVEHGEGCAACGMEGRLGCGCKQEQGRAALELAGWKRGGR